MVESDKKLEPLIGSFVALLVGILFIPVVSEITSLALSGLSNHQLAQSLAQLVTVIYTIILIVTVLSYIKNKLS